MFKRFGLTIISLFFLCLPMFALANEEKVDIYLFWAEGCPHCSDEKEFLNDLSKNKEYKNVLELHYYNMSEQGSLQALKMFAQKLDFKVSGVPVTVIKDWYTIGFNNDDTTGEEIKEQINNLLNNSDPSDEDNINLPLVGSIDLKSWSLPALTILIGFLDGFNPCAMWALLFLISLLLGMKNTRRMWLLGSVFIIASALVYFIFMAAWLNFILFIGLVIWFRILIAAVSLAGGGLNLRKFWKNRGGGCEIAEKEKKQKTFARLKEVVRKKQLWLALVGIIALAFTVNLVELICSAGLPAVYTQILAMNDLSVLQYYGYISLYIFFFMLDDLFIFFIAMTTLRLTGISTKYSRWSSLIGGILMIIIGLLLLFKHEWLMLG
ncbi:MAG: thioredoxin family protein [bacterium]